MNGTVNLNRAKLILLHLRAIAMGCAINSSRETQRQRATRTSGRFHQRLAHLPACIELMMPDELFSLSAKLLIRGTLKGASAGKPSLAVGNS